MASAAVAVLSVGAASAATLTFAPTPAPFESDAFTLLAGIGGSNDVGSVEGQRFSPWGESDGFAWVSGDAEYTFDTLGTFFSLVWGSPDAYNTLYFYNDAALVDSVNGVEVEGYNVLSPGVNVPNSLVTITTDAAFNRVVFSSRDQFGDIQSSFEWGAVSIVPTVPLPAGGLLLLSGLAGVAALRRRKSV
jgi:hypothetical protein